MKTLILIAHGSRIERSNDEIKSLSEAVAAKVRGRFEIVCCAFLEIAAPSIPEAIESCIQSGADEILLYPYFLTAGRHVLAARYGVVCCCDL